MQLRVQGSGTHPKPLLGGSGDLVSSYFIDFYASYPQLESFKVTYTSTLIAHFQSPLTLQVPEAARGV